MITDYTESLNFLSGFIQQYRILKYFKDILNNWFADKRNIKDDRLSTLLYDSDGNLNNNYIRINTPFTDNESYSGTTPCIVISLEDITYQKPSGVIETSIQENPMMPIATEWRMKSIPITISILTESYDGTVLLALLILTFLTINSDNIRRDNRSLSFVMVLSISAPKKLNNGEYGNAKDLYMSAIKLNTQGTLIWALLTQGPVFKGFRKPI